MDLSHLSDNARELVRSLIDENHSLRQEVSACLECIERNKQETAVELANLRKSFAKFRDTNEKLNEENAHLKTKYAIKGGVGSGQGQGQGQPEGADAGADASSTEGERKRKSEREEPPGRTQAEEVRMKEEKAKEISRVRARFEEESARVGGEEKRAKTGKGEIAEKSLPEDEDDDDDDKEGEEEEGAEEEEEEKEKAAQKEKQKKKEKPKRANAVIMFGTAKPTSCPPAKPARHLR